MTSKNLTILLCLPLFFCLPPEVVQQTIVIPGGCNPRLQHRYDVCPDGYCCARNEFLPMKTHCRRIGIIGDACTTRDSESACPCQQDLQCRPNIVSPTFASLYGTCRSISQDAN